MTISTTTTMLPYCRHGEIDYASLDFNADELEVPPDHMEQDREIHEIYSLIYAHVTGFGARSDIFLSFDTNVCYDQGNLNVRIVPDLYLAFGVDAEASARANCTCPGRRANRRTWPWKWHRKAPPKTMSGENRTSTPE